MSWLMMCMVVCVEGCCVWGVLRFVVGVVGKM